MKQVTCPDCNGRGEHRVVHPACVRPVSICPPSCKTCGGTGLVTQAVADAFVDTADADWLATLGDRRLAR